jgi:hypothetical protein
MLEEKAYEVRIEGQTLYVDFNYDIEGEPAEPENGFRGASYIANIHIFDVMNEQGEQVQYYEEEIEAYIIENFEI